MDSKRFWIILAVIVVGFFGFLALYKKDNAGENGSVASSQGSSNYYGKDDSPVTVTEFVDFQCEACYAYYPYVKQVKEQYKNQVRFQVRHFPITSGHQFAMQAARNAEAAARQGKFWEMHDKLFEGQKQWERTQDPTSYFDSYAKDIALDMTITHNGKRIHVSDPKTRLLIKRVFNAYLEPNHSIATTVDLMAKMGIRTRGGRPYVKSQVQKILMNPFYIGINRFNGKDYPGAQERLVSADVFEKIQKKMRRPIKGRFRQHNPVLKNIIRCNGCKGLVTWQLQKGRYYGTCQQSTKACKGRKLLREDKVEEAVMEMLKQLVCPSQELIHWVAETMREQHYVEIEAKERLWDSVKLQIERIERMDEGLYEDKLAGEISPERYQDKHKTFCDQKSELEKQLTSVDRSVGARLDQTLVLLELSQKAAEIYQKKTPQQKRLIITKLFKEFTYDNKFLSVSFTNFTQIIANNVQETRILMGGEN